VTTAISNAQECIGVREAATRLNFSFKHVYELVYAGKLPATKVWGRWQIPVRAVEARVKARLESGNDD
jgi:excisionase family DNA binding protein